jgi:hypothetical protein
VLEQHRTAAWVGQIPIAPLEQRNDHRIQVNPLASQVVLEAGRVFLVLAASEDVMVDESSQARSQNVAGDAKVFVELIEAMRAEEHLTYDQHAPGIAQDVERAGDGAGGTIGERVARVGLHARTLPEWVALSN